jgi:hypothetical protein
LNSSQKEVRKYVFDHFFERSVPPVLEEVVQHFGISRSEGFSRLWGFEIVAYWGSLGK